MRGSTRKRGKKWYYYFTTSEGKKIERVGGDTQAEAEASLTEALADYHKRGEVIMDSNMPLSKYLSKWLDDSAKTDDLREGTIQQYRRLFTSHIFPQLGNTRLNKLTPALLQSFINEQKASGNAKTGGPISKNTLLSITSLLSSALNDAVYPYQLLRESPMQYIRFPRYREEPAAESKIVSPEDFEKLIEHFRKKKRYMEIPLLIQYYTGCRPGEACALTWDCIDAKTITIKSTLRAVVGGVEVGPPKTSTSYRTIQVSPVLLKILDGHRHRQMQDKLFYGADYITYDQSFICTRPNGKVFTPNDVTMSLSKACKTLEMPHIHAHMLRHTHATMLWEAGADQNDIKNRLGHKTLAMTADRYAHDTPEMQRRTVEIFDNTLATQKTSDGGK